MTIRVEKSSPTGFTLSTGTTCLAEVRFHIGRMDLDLQPDEGRQEPARQAWWCEQTGGLRVEISVTSLPEDAVLMKANLRNNGGGTVQIEPPANIEVRLNPVLFNPHKQVYSMQGAAVGWGQDFAFKLPVPFERDNYLGHLQDGEGGGIPVNYFWNETAGLAVMHLDLTPQEAYLPVLADPSGIRTAFELRRGVEVAPGETFSLPEIAISYHRGDFFAPLVFYRRQMEARGCSPAQPSPACFEPAWCSWGYEFDIRPDQMLGVLPALEELNIHWLTLDDRWFDSYGDWNPRADTFPQGEGDMRRMNGGIHAAGGYSQIWWYPLCAEDGHGEWESHIYGQSSILKEHPDWVVLHEDGSVARNNRHLAMLCPALPEVQEYTRRLTEKFISDWGFDGHKLDNIYTMPACHNPAHRHASPQDSVRAFGQVYRQIFETTRRLKPNSVTQICPCGTPITHSLIPSVDQTVTADPTSSAQVRQRIKFYKALMGPGAAVFADHVELTDGACDFASGIGTGGVPSTKFVFPDDPELKARLNEYWNLPPEKKTTWKKWLGMYSKHRPAEGEYLNLYDLAFDRPEGHVIRKDGVMYYGFFTPQYTGKVELRGLN